MFCPFLFVKKRFNSISISNLKKTYGNKLTISNSPGGWEKEETEKDF